MMFLSLLPVADSRGLSWVPFVWDTVTASTIQAEDKVTAGIEEA